MTLILENLFSRTANSDIFRGFLFRKWNVLRFFASTYSPVMVSTIFCEDLFSRMVPPQAFRKNLFLPKGTKFAKLAKINSLTVYL